jgi:signal peptidase I
MEGFENLSQNEDLSKGRKALRWLRDALETALPAVLIAFLINLFLAQATQVHGQSMEPTLHSDQRLVVEKVSYHFHCRPQVPTTELRASHQKGHRPPRRDD